MNSPKPYLIIVTGRPAAGKSTLAKWLSKELKLPVVSKDTIRELLFDQLGWTDREWAKVKKVPEEVAGYRHLCFA